MTPEQLKQWRHGLKSQAGRRNCSQAEAARRLNTPRRTYEDWEAGKRRIPGMLGLACAAVVRELPPWP